MKFVKSLHCSKYLDYCCHKIELAHKLPEPLWFYKNTDKQPKIRLTFK